eukprot:c22969_g1_i1 orf=646-1632(+)
MNSDTSDSACLFFKKHSKSKNLRKRVAEEEDDEGDDTGSAIVAQKAKAPKKVGGGLEFSSQAPVVSESLISKNENSHINEVKGGSFLYESSKEIQTQTDNRATAVSETETEFNKDARAIRERVLKQAEEALKGKGLVDNKVYKGLHGYTDYKAGFRREQTIAGEKAGGAHGPLRASAHIRWSVRFDYQPDICKDYKETGYCGYGDACKFMHDRGDYKSGWQMEREWDEEKKRERDQILLGMEEEKEEEEADDDDLPFACLICRQPFNDPVVTLCRHYFCEHCALKHHARNKNCFVCNKPTSGVFNTAHEILKKMKVGTESAGKKLRTR